MRAVAPDQVAWVPRVGPAYRPVAPAATPPPTRGGAITVPAAARTDATLEHAVPCGALLLAPALIRRAGSCAYRLGEAGGRARPRCHPATISSMNARTARPARAHTRGRSASTLMSTSPRFPGEYYRELCCRATRSNTEQEPRNGCVRWPTMVLVAPGATGTRIAANFTDSNPL